MNMKLESSENIQKPSTINKAEEKDNKIVESLKITKNKFFI